MTIVGFNFNKIEVSKKEGTKGKVNIKNNITITDIQEKNIELGAKDQNALKFFFEFTSSYEPALGRIMLGGDLLFIDEAKKTKAILEEWKKTRKIAKDLMRSILNTVLTRCNIEALILSQKVNLPPPIPLPSIKKEGK